MYKVLLILFVIQSFTLYSFAEWRVYDGEISVNKISGGDCKPYVLKKPVKKRILINLENDVHSGYFYGEDELCFFSGTGLLNLPMECEDYDDYNRKGHSISIESLNEKSIELKINHKHLTSDKDSCNYDDASGVFNRYSDADIEKLVAQQKVIFENLALYYEAYMTLRFGLYPLTEEKYNELRKIYVDAGITDDLHLSVAYFFIGYSQDKQNKKDAAIENYTKALKFFETYETRADHAYVLRKLAKLFEKDNPEKAERYYLDAVNAVENDLFLDEENLERAYTDLGAFYTKVLKFDEAEKYLNKALILCVKLYGAESVKTARNLFHLATNYAGKTDFIAAEEYYRKSLEAFTVSNGENNSETSIAVWGLAEACLLNEKYAEAEELFKRSYAIDSKVYKPDSLEMAKSMNNLGQYYMRQERFTEAEPLMLGALKIKSEHFDTYAPEMETISNNLSQMYSGMENYTEALKYAFRAFGINSNMHTMTTLGSLLMKLGVNEDAEKMFKDALKDSIKRYGSKSKETAVCLNNLGFFYQSIGQFDDSEEYLMRALALREQLFGSEHHETGNSLWSRGLVYAQTGNHEKANDMFIQYLNIVNKFRDDLFEFMSDEQKIGFIKRNSDSVYYLISHLNQFFQHDKDKIKEVFEIWLKWKGVLLDAQSKSNFAFINSDDPDVRIMWERYTSIKKEIMDIYVDTSIKADKKKKTLDELFSEHAGLEYELNKSVHLADVKDGENISINRISDIIDSVSGRGAYIDFALIDDINFENVETRGKKYVAFLLLNDSIHLINIGSAEKVDSMIRSYRELAGVKSESAINLSKTDHFGRELYDLVYKPIHLLLNDVDHIFISPDGMLNMLPFEALKDETNKYLLDKALVSYVSAGRDIMRFGVLESKSEKAVLFYNPDFEALDISHAAEYRSAKNFDFGSIRFSPLPQTAAEAKYILDVLEEGEIPVETFSGADASESNLYSLNKPKILHIATHGFFVDGDGSPMYRSGFALAGASESVKKGISDGLMSADKITGANLHGTDLVVLSACDTGAGEVMNGEGVFGLKRAFMLSGAKSVVFSNWKVSDRVTAEFMGKFYEYMLSEKYNRAEALRRAQLDIKDRYRSPFYWASFSLTGDPGFRKQD